MIALLKQYERVMGAVPLRFDADIPRKDGGHTLITFNTTAPAPKNGLTEPSLNELFIEIRKPYFPVGGEYSVIHRQGSLLRKEVDRCLSDTPFSPVRSFTDSRTDPPTVTEHVVPSYACYYEATPDTLRVRHREIVRAGIEPNKVKGFLDKEYTTDDPRNPARTTRIILKAAAQKPTNG